MGPRKLNLGCGAGKASAGITAMKYAKLLEAGNSRGKKKMKETSVRRQNGVRMLAFPDPRTIHCKNPGES